MLREAGGPLKTLSLSCSRTESISIGEAMAGTGAPGEIRTPDLLLRRQPLYPAELRAHGGSSTVYMGLAAAAMFGVVSGPLSVAVASDESRTILKLATRGDVLARH